MESVLLIRNTTMKTPYEKVVVRLWKSTGNYILIFPEDKQPGGLLNSFEWVGQHGSRDPKDVIRATIPATYQQAQHAVQEYETLYNCKLKIVKRVSG